MFVLSNLDRRIFCILFVNSLSNYINSVHIQPAHTMAAEMRSSGGKYLNISRSVLSDNLEISDLANNLQVRAYFMCNSSRLQNYRVVQGAPTPSPRIRTLNNQ